MGNIINKVLGAFCIVYVIGLFCMCFYGFDRLHDAADNLAQHNRVMAETAPKPEGKNGDHLTPRDFRMFTGRVLMRKEGNIMTDSVLISPASGKWIRRGAPIGQLIAKAQAYTNTVKTTGATGNAVFYLTTDKTVNGVALYPNGNLDIVVPVVNDSGKNYTYGWVLAADKKTLTVNVKTSGALTIAALNITVLGVPANVPSGTDVQVMVKGN